MADNGKPETTDAWSFGKILKYVLLPKPKGSPRAGRKEKLLRLGFFLVLGFLAVSMLTGERAATAIPGCSDAETQAALKRSIRNSPAGRTTGLRVIGASDIREEKWSEGQQVRTCSARLQTNAGEHPAIYSMKWLRKGQWYLEVRMLGAP